MMRDRPRACAQLTPDNFDEVVGGPSGLASLLSRSDFVIVAVPKTGTRTVLATLDRAGGAVVVQGRQFLETRCNEYLWWATLRAGVDVAYGGAVFAPGDDPREAFHALLAACNGATAAAAASAVGGGGAPFIFYDHVGYMPALADRAAFVAVLREPIEWAASHFYFLRDEPWPRGLGKNVSLEAAVLEDPDSAYLSFFSEVRNAQARYLCGAHPQCALPHGQSPTELLDRFAVVGVLEDLPATFRALAATLPRALGGLPGAYVDGGRAFLQPGDGARPRGGDEGALAPAAEAVLRAWLAEDVALHAAATARLAAILRDAD